jgi:hypothetical protein
MNTFLIHDIQYKKWKPQIDARCTEFVLAPVGDKTVLRSSVTSISKSCLLQDIEAIVSRFKSDATDRGAQSLDDLAEQALLAIKKRKHDPNWSKRIAEQMTSAAD